MATDEDVKYWQREAMKLKAELVDLQSQVAVAKHEITKRMQQHEQSFSELMAITIVLVERCAGSLDPGCKLTIPNEELAGVIEGTKLHRKYDEGSWELWVERPAEEDSRPKLQLLGPDGRPM